MDDHSLIFLDAYNAIDHWLRDRGRVAPGMDYHEVVDLVAEKHKGVKRHAVLLKKLGRLRNLVVHEYSRDKSMTVPTSHTVERILAIRDELLAPPTLLSVSTQPVAMCNHSDPVGCAAKKMLDGPFSQLPVYDGNTFTGLLTAETVARWLASNLAAGEKLVEEKPVADVLRHQEDKENHTFLSRTATVFDGLSAFDDFLHRGKKLEAILLTHNGRSNEQVLGIITVHDIPKMQRALRE